MALIQGWDFPGSDWTSPDPDDQRYFAALLEALKERAASVLFHKLAKGSIGYNHLLSHLDALPKSLTGETENVMRSFPFSAFDDTLKTCVPYFRSNDISASLTNYFKIDGVTKFVPGVDTIAYDIGKYPVFAYDGVEWWKVGVSSYINAMTLDLPYYTWDSLCIDFLKLSGTEIASPVMTGGTRDSSPWTVSTWLSTRYRIVRALSTIAFTTELREARRRYVDAEGESSLYNRHETTQRLRGEPGYGWYCYGVSAANPPCEDTLDTSSPTSASGYIEGAGMPSYSYINEVHEAFSELHNIVGYTAANNVSGGGVNLQVNSPWRSKHRIFLVERDVSSYEMYPDDPPVNSDVVTNTVFQEVFCEYDASRTTYTDSGYVSMDFPVPEVPPAGLTTEPLYPWDYPYGLPYRREVFSHYVIKTIRWYPGILIGGSITVDKEEWQLDPLNKSGMMLSMAASPAQKETYTFASE